MSMNNKALVALAKHIKNIRCEANISQEELALRANVDRSFLSRLERGLANPSYLILLRISEALEKSPKELIPD
jgi:transcriptional regulator with XRE-family HTH domain